MKLGIKVGLQKNSSTDLLATNPQIAEVWFDIGRADEYSELFNALKRQRCEVGLHFWGALPDNTWTNLAYPDKNLIHESLILMRRTIEIAARNGFQYVNIHPGTAARVKLFFDREEFVLDSTPVPFARAEQLFLENVGSLYKIAADNGVVLTVETVPSRVSKGWYEPGARKNPLNIYELPIEVVMSLASLGKPVANDFGHTAGNIISDNPETVWSFLKTTTEQLAGQTSLIHLGFIKPPYNGTDNHDSLDNPVLLTDQAIPNKKQMIELLRLFRNRDDVWILSEPVKDHVKNYFLAKKLIDLVKTA